MWFLTSGDLDRLPFQLKIGTLIRSLENVSINFGFFYILSFSSYEPVPYGTDERARSWAKFVFRFGGYHMASLSEVQGQSPWSGSGGEAP